MNLASKITICMANVYFLSLCGCYSSIPRYRNNLKLDYGTLDRGPILLAPIHGAFSIDSAGIDGLNDVKFSHDLADSLVFGLANGLNKRSGRKVQYNACMDSARKYVFYLDTIEIAYYLDGVHHGISLNGPLGASNHQLPKNAVWEINSIRAEVLDSNEFNRLRCGSNLVLYLTDIHFSFANFGDNNSQGVASLFQGKLVQFSGGYVLWDYRNNQYVTEGKLGPIVVPLRELTNRLADYIQIANHRWL